MSIWAQLAMSVIGGEQARQKKQQSMASKAISRANQFNTGGGRDFSREMAMDSGEGAFTKGAAGAMTSLFENQAKKRAELKQQKRDKVFLKNPSGYEALFKARAAQKASDELGD